MEEIKTIDVVLNLGTTNISTEQLQNVYKITQRLRKEDYDDYKELTDDQLKYKIAYNLCCLSPSDKQEKQKYLNKAYEFNNLISDKFRGINVGYLNFYLRCDLIEEFTELGGQENLDKAYTIYQQVLKNLKGITIYELNDLRYNLIVKYLQLENFTQENLDKTKEIFNSIDLKNVGNELNDYIKLQQNILEKETELRINDRQQDDNLEDEIVNEVINQTFEEHRQETQENLYTLENIQQNISSGESIESFLESIKTKDGQKYLMDSLFVRYFTDPCINTLSKGQQAEINSFQCVCKRFFLTGDEKLLGFLGNSINKSSAIRYYTKHVLIKRMTDKKNFTNLKTVINLINSGDDLNKTKKQDISSKFIQFIQAKLQEINKAEEKQQQMIQNELKEIEEKEKQQQMIQNGLKEIEEQNKTKENIKSVFAELEKRVKTTDENVADIQTTQEDELEEESRNLSSAEEELGEILEEQRQQTHLRYYNPVSSRDYDQMFNELNQAQPKRSGSAPII